MTKLLGVQVAHGLTSETRVFAELLAERDARYDSCVLMHQENGTTGDIDRFAALAHTPGHHDRHGLAAQPNGPPAQP